MPRDPASTLGRTRAAAGYAVGGPKRVLLAAPRGYCAGVDRAVVAVEKALEHYGSPGLRAQADRAQRARRQRARGAGRDLRRRGRRGAAEGSHVVFSAHGVSPAVVRAAADRGLQAIDATCPLVTKVHREAVRFAARRLRDPAHRPRRPRGGRGHDGGGARAHHAGRLAGRGRHRRGARPRQAGLALPDHPLRRRDDGDGPPPARALPEPAGSAARRHLLRHAEPPGRDQEGRRATPTS